MNTLSPRRAGLLLALLQGGLLLSLGAVRHMDRVRLPRAWVRTAPHDPELPIRGRYVSLRLLVPAPELRSLLPLPDAQRCWQAVRLVAKGDRLEALPGAAAAASRPSQWACVDKLDNTAMARLDEPVAFFLPPDVDDPSQRTDGKTLWVEVTVPPEGPPRPIRLGLSAKGGGRITPLQLR
ncbi:MAG: hypothetical protein ACK5QW_05650 [Cyanobacteriota bacterium]